MRRRALLAGGAGKKMELYLTTTNSQSSNYAFGFENSKDTKATFVVRDLNGVELFRQKSTTFDFSRLTGIRRIYYEGTENQIKNISRIYNSEGSDIHEFALSPLLKNIYQFSHRGNNTSIGTRGIDGIPATWTKLTRFIVSGSANSNFSLIPKLNFSAFELSGLNTVSVIPEMPLCVIFQLSGLNTVSVIPDMPSCTIFTLSGLNTASVIPDMPNVETLTVSGQHSQPILDLYTNFTKLTHCTIGVSSVLAKISYTNRRNFPNGMRRVLLIDGTGGLSTDPDQVANLIIDLSKSSWNLLSANPYIEIKGNALPPTPSPELTAALTYFESIGVPVRTN